MGKNIGFSGQEESDFKRSSEEPAKKEAWERAQEGHRLASFI
jgi:hypothetical protein